MSEGLRSVFEGSRPSAEQFVREVLPAMGAEWEEGRDGITWVMLPGEAELRRLTFESELAREDPEVEWIGYGSRFIEDLARLAYSSNPLSRAWANPYLRPPPESGFSRAYQLKAGRVECAPWTQRLWTTWVFAFGIGLEGEFRREVTFLCAVDAASGRLVRRFEQPFSQPVFLPEGPQPSVDKPFEECYAVARGEAVQKAWALSRTGQRESLEALQLELACLSRYYDGLLEEAGEDLTRWSTQDSRRASIVSRMEATRLGCERAVVQAKERYRLELKLEAIGALGIVYPHLVRMVTLLDKTGRSVQVEVAYDPLFERLDPLTCPSCRKPSYALEMHRNLATCGCVPS